MVTAKHAMCLFRLSCKIEKTTISAPLRSRVALVSVSLNHFRPLSSTTVSQSRRLSNKKLRAQKLFSVETGGKLWKVWLSAALGPTDGVGDTDSTLAMTLAAGLYRSHERWTRVVRQDGILRLERDFRLAPAAELAFLDWSLIGYVSLRQHQPCQVDGNQNVCQEEHHRPVVRMVN